MSNVNQLDKSIFKSPGGRKKTQAEVDVVEMSCRGARAKYIYMYNLVSVHCKRRSNRSRMVGKLSVLFVIKPFVIPFNFDRDNIDNQFMSLILFLVDGI